MRNFTTATFRNRNTDQIQKTRRITDEEAADINSPQGMFGDNQPAAARGEDGSAARGEDDAATRGDDAAAARDDEGSVARGDDDAAAHGEDGSITRGFPRPAKGRETRAFGGPG